MLSRGDTVGVFQIESSGMRRFITELKPTCFDDVIAAVSLFRPGPLDASRTARRWSQPFVDRKHGKEPVEYDHPLLEPVLRDTYGVIMYQEQVMRAAQALAGYSLEQADILRAAMGKKNKAVMERERERFIDGAKNNGVNAALADSIFEKIETFASYGFNRSHAAAYALTTYTTAYLKAHYPARVHGGADVARHGRRRQDLQEYRGAARDEDRDSAARCESEPGQIHGHRRRDSLRAGARFAASAAKTGEAIVAEREANGPFESMADFCMRVGTQLISRRVLDALIKCGAFDSVSAVRAALMAEAENAIKIAQKAQSDAAQNQIGLFGGAVKVPKLAAREPIPEWDAREKLKYEKEALGFYITAHPLDKYERELARISKLTTADLSSAPDGSQVHIAGVIHAVKLKNNKSGKRYATFSLEDREGAVEAIAWSETYQKFEAVIMGDEPVVARGKLDVDDERAQIILDDLRRWIPRCSIRFARCESRRRAALENGGLDALKEMLRGYRGKSMTYLHLGLDDGREAVLLLGDSYRVTPTDTFVAEMEQISRARRRGAEIEVAPVILRGVRSARASLAVRYGLTPDSFSKFCADRG